MPRTTKQAAKQATAVLIAIVVLVIGAPPTLGMASPSELRRSTTRIRTIRASNIAPGDSFSETVQFHNYNSDSLAYQLVFVREGKLWRCDPSGNSLYYEVAWSVGADQRLKPGETETATITVHFPLAAGNECQGDTGHLLVRRGLIRDSGKGGVYECRPLPIAYRGRKILGADDDLNRHLCWNVNGLLHPLLNRW